MSKTILSCQQLNKTFHDGKSTLEVIKKIDFSVTTEETISILGRSGSGKSTFLHLLGGLELPSSGEVFWNETNIQYLSEAERCTLRNKMFGFVYQFHHLLPEFSTLENVAMPLLIGSCSKAEAKERSYEILKKVGLVKRLAHHVGELSGGERQRVAIARALVTRPLCLLADEPTGNLDEYTANEVFNLMLELNQASSTALIMVTHDMILAHKMQRILSMEEGSLK